jgi:hypothetical protein
MSAFDKLLGKQKNTLSTVDEAFNWIVADGNRTSTWWDPKSADQAYTTNRVLSPEEEPKAPKHLPFHMEIASGQLDQSILSVKDALTTYINAYKNGLFTMAEKDALKSEIKRLKGILKALDNTRMNLSKFVLGF